MKQKTAFRSLHTLALALAFALLFVLVGGGEARAAEGDEAPYEEVFDGGYKIEGSGYLFVGTEKAVLFNGNPRNTAAAATAEELADGKEIVNVSTAAHGTEPIELGGITFQPVAVSGSQEGTIYLSVGRRVMVSGDLLGSGTLMLNKQYPDSEGALKPYQSYCDYLESLDALGEKVDSMKDLTVCASGAVLDQQYFEDIHTILTKFVKAEDTTSYVLKVTDAPGDFSIEWGSATVVVHMPIGGLYGYDLGGTTMCTSDDQYKFYVLDYGKFQSIHDTDIQSCYLLMNDEEALIVDVDMYNGKLFFETLCDLIGDRDLYIYITHQHGDHWINLKDFDPDRVTTLYWPEDDIPGAGGPGGWSDSFPAVVDSFGDKITYVKEGDELNIAGRELVVTNMTAHTPHGTMLVDKTDRVLFSGDALGTRQYVGGTNTGSLSAEDYLAELDHVMETYGSYFDTVQQGHSALVLKGEIETLQILTRAFIENGSDSLVQGAVISFMDRVLTAEEFANIFGNGVYDSQIAYAERLDISRTALEAQNS